MKIQFKRTLRAELMNLDIELQDFLYFNDSGSDFARNKTTSRRIKTGVLVVL